MHDDFFSELYGILCLGKKLRNFMELYNESGGMEQLCLTAIIDSRVQGLRLPMALLSMSIITP